MDILIIAHRGASHEAPENTLPAIQKALAAGVDLISLEVQKTKDDQAIVLADVSVDRTTNGKGRSARMTAKQLEALDAGSWFGAPFSGTRIPTLAQALTAAGKARLLLSLPETRSGTPWLDELTQTLKARANPQNDVLLFTDSESLKTVREKLPDFAYTLALDARVDGWLFLEKAAKMNLTVIRPYRAQIDSVLVGQARAKNIKVFAHFANEESDLRALIEVRVDGIVTARPERMKTLVAELSKPH